MDKCNSIEHDFLKTPNMYPNLSANISNEQQARLNQINEMKYYFIAEIRERELISKNLSKYTASLMDNEISHEDFETIINEEKKYRELKESIRMMNSQRTDIGKVSLIEEGKRIGINEVIKPNEVIKNSLK